MLDSELEESLNFYYNYGGSARYIAEEIKHKSEIRWKELRKRRINKPMTTEEINKRALKQVLSIEQMKTLKRLGVNTDNAFWSWTRVVTDIAGVPISKPWKLILNEPIAISNSESYERVPTFSLPEILELLPSKIGNADLGIAFGMDHWTMSYVDYLAAKILTRSVGLELIGAAYEMLHWLASNDKYRSYIVNK